MKDEQHSICTSCGATVYREHLDSGIARYEGDKLLCSFCVAEYERAHDASGSSAGSMTFEPISIHGDDDDDTPPPAKSKIVTTTAVLGEAGAWDENRYKRPADPKSVGATRCRTFHSKLNESSLEFMNRQINEWIDANKDIAVKFATTSIGVFEGKHAEPNLILTVFY